MKGGETGVEMGPVSGEPELIRFEVFAPPLGTGSYGSAAELWVDGLRVGSVSNLRLSEPLRVGGFGAGIHNYRLLVEVYRRDTELQYSSSGSVLGAGPSAAAEWRSLPRRLGAGILSDSGSRGRAHRGPAVVDLPTGPGSDFRKI